MSERRSIRLPDYDYGQGPPYFVTICTRQRQLVFGRILNGTMHPSSIGLIVLREWHATADLRPTVVLDEFSLLPDHLHGILGITGPGIESQVSSPVARRFGNPLSGDLPAIVGAFKSAVTRAVHAETDFEGDVWQRGYFEHVIRNQKGLERIRQYIRTNVLRWRSNGSRSDSVQRNPEWRYW